ncbi:hypothetical protein PENTCL1PPCAC_12188, partial [Pristionchus entomophagus]
LDVTIVFASVCMVLLLNNLPELLNDCVVVLSIIRRKLRPVVATVISHSALISLGAQPWLTNEIFMKPITMPLMEFPGIILLEIFDRLSFIDRMSIRSVNRRLFTLEPRAIAATERTK